MHCGVFSRVVLFFILLQQIDVSPGSDFNFPKAETKHEALLRLCRFYETYSFVPEIQILRCLDEVFLFPLHEEQEITVEIDFGACFSPTKRNRKIDRVH